MKTEVNKGLHADFEAKTFLVWEIQEADSVPWQKRSLFPTKQMISYDLTASKAVT